MAYTEVVLEGYLVSVFEEGLVYAIAILWREAEIHAEEHAKAEEYSARCSQWISHMRTCGNGCVDLQLDDIVDGDPKKKQEFLDNIDLAEQKIRKFGNMIPGAYLDSIADMNYKEGQECPSETLLTVLAALRDLLTARRNAVKMKHWPMRGD